MVSISRTGTQLVATYVLSLAMFVLAAALVYFAYEASRVSTLIPEILTSVDNTTENVEPIINEVGEIRLLIPDILHEIEQTREMVPAVLKEVEETRKLVPPVLKEIEQVRQQIPPVLREVKAVREEVPAVVKSANKASNAVVVVAKEIEATRPLVPMILEEVETTRESIPPMLDRADAMIDKARVAGKDASSGAVTGFFKGLVTAPFVLVGDAGRALTGMSEEEMKEFTEKDFDLFEAAALDLLNNGKKGDIREVNNPDSDMSATFKLVKVEIEEEDFVTVECRTLQSESYKTGERIKTVNRTFCKEEGSGWDIDR